MASFEFDAAVIGAGPGGAACALAAAREGLRVLLVDPQGEVFDKPCGEGVMPSGLRALADLGVEVAARDGFRFRHLRFVHEGRDALDIELDADACSLERPRLLALLGGALQEQARVVRVCAHARTRALANGFELSMRPTARGGRGTVSTARALIAADGSGGRSAAWLRGAPRARRSERIGIRLRCALRAPMSGVEVHIGRGAEVYLTPLSERTVNVAVLLERTPTGVHGAAALCEWALERHPRAKSRLGDVLTCAVARTLDRSRPRTVADGDAFLIGDAAGAIDPILGCGVALALEGAIAASRAVRARIDGESAHAVASRYRAEWQSMSASRRELARGLRFLSSHPRIAAGFLSLLRGSPRLRRRLCRIVAGEGLRLPPAPIESSAACAM
jgi:flavin-dependent dehydrogenase